MSHIMFHAGSAQRHRMPHRNIVSTYIASSSIIPGKEHFRRGVLFSTVAGIVLTAGGLLTWMGYNNVFSGRANVIGPLLIFIAIILFLFSAKQFLLSKQQARLAQEQIQTFSRDGVASMVIDGENGIGAVTVVVDRVDMSPEMSSRSIYSEYAPPTYSEAIGQNHTPPSSQIREPSLTETDSEPPPTYDEAVAALHIRSDQILIPIPYTEYCDFVSHTSIPPVCNTPVCAGQATTTTTMTTVPSSSSASPAISASLPSTDMRNQVRPKLHHQVSIDEESDDSIREEFTAGRK